MFASPVWAAEGYIVGLGLEADDADGLSVSVSGDLGITSSTWISAAIAKSTVDLPQASEIDTVYADIGLDHWFDPVGVRLSVAYWGDSDILDSNDSKAAVYWRNDKLTLSAEYEYRDFSFDVFRDNLRPGQDFRFHASGVGLSARIALHDRVDLRLSAIDYDYNVNLGVAANRPILDFLSVSRLSLINSLIDKRARIGLAVDFGDQRWSLDLATWKSEVDASKTHSATLRLLTPLSRSSDIEIGFGVDNSNDYGSALLLSISLYFYG